MSEEQYNSGDLIDHLTSDHRLPLEGATDGPALMHAALHTYGPILGLHLDHNHDRQAPMEEPDFAQLAADLGHTADEWRQAWDLLEPDADATWAILLGMYQHLDAPPTTGARLILGGMGQHRAGGDR